MCYCENCKVEVEENKSNCALCGRSITKDPENKNNYYPQYTPVVDKKEPIVSILQKLALFALVISIIINLFVEQTLSWSLYVLAGIMLCVTIILRAILKKWSVAQVCSSLAFWLSGFLIFIEFYTQTWGWGVIYAVPSLWLAICVFFAITIFVRGYVDFEMFKPLILITIFSLTLVLVLYLTGFLVLWPSITVMLVSFSEIVLMFMFRFKRSIRSLKRDLGF